MAQPDIQPLAVDVERAAAMITQSPAQVYKLMNAGLIKSFHIGRSRRIKVSELEKFLDMCESGEIDVSAALTA